MDASPESAVPHSDDYDAAYYDANGQQDDRPALGLYTRLVMRYLDPEAVLEVGCGTGHFLRRLAQHATADGYEISAYSAARAREHSPTSSVWESPSDLPALKYDAFTAIHVFEHIPDEQLVELLAELRRATTSDMRALVVMPDAGGRAARLHGERWNALTDPTHINLKSHDEWLAFFAANGIEVERQGTDGMWNFPYSRLPKLLDGLRYGLPMAAQFISGRMFVSPGKGESCFFVIRWAD